MVWICVEVWKLACTVVDTAVVSCLTDPQGPRTDHPAMGLPGFLLKLRSYQALFLSSHRLPGDSRPGIGQISGTSV